MRSGKRSILTPVDSIIIPEVKSYWATHFYSLLKCIDSHKNLQFSPRKLEIFPIWTLSHLRGNLPLNFFEKIDSFIQNWGVQYFFASFFNQKIGGHIIIELIERLEDLYNVCFNKNLDTFSFYVSGNDSILSYKLSERFSEIFPFQELKEDTYNLISHSDLCLILENSFTQNSVAIFGEVEGLHGNKLRHKKYWDKKSNFCVFGIGVVDGNQKQVYFEENYHKNIPRVILFFERSHFIISDFYKVLKAFHYMFLNGPLHKYPKVDEEFDFFYNYLINNWNTPIEEIFIYLEQFLDGGELVGYNDGTIQIIPSIQST